MLLEAARGGHTAVASLILRQPKEVVGRSRVASVTKSGGDEEVKVQQEAAQPCGQKVQAKVVLGKTYSDPGSVGQHGGGALEAEPSNPKPIQQGVGVEGRPEVAVGQEKPRPVAAKTNFPDIDVGLQRHSGTAREAASTAVVGGGGGGSQPPPQTKVDQPSHCVADSSSLLRNNQHARGEPVEGQRGGQEHLTQSEIIIRNYMQQQQQEAAAHSSLKQNGGSGPSMAESAQALAQNIFALGNLKSTLASKVGSYPSAQPQNVTQSSAQVAPTVLTSADLGRLLPVVDSVPGSLSSTVENYLAAISQGHIIPNLEELARSLVACERGDMTPSEEAELKQRLQRATESQNLELERAHKRPFSSTLLQDCNFPANIPPPSDLIPDHVSVCVCVGGGVLELCGVLM